MTTTPGWTCTIASGNCAKSVHSPFTTYDDLEAARSNMRPHVAEALSYRRLSHLH
ncbi:MAG: hypothetical protein JOZ72_01605 [Alphaproteobacteria bacterium]|nr:hypothetical protein [Alphaproteobacteria bacterium]